MLEHLRRSIAPLIPERYRPAARAALDAGRVAAARLHRRLFPRPEPASAELRLHLGCGVIDLPDFVNVDAWPYPHVHHVRAIHDLSFLDDSVAGLIYACHCLEHFPRSQIPAVLREWFRVTRPGGVLRLSVPDFDSLAALCRDAGNDLAPVQACLLGGQDSRLNFHYTLFNRRSLSELLVDAGFREVREWDPRSSAHSSLEDWSSKQLIHDGRSYPVSLNLEAVK